MIPLIQSNLPAIRALCRTHRVRSLHIFGSASTDTFDPTHSDLDFLVEFLPDAARTGLSGAYFALRDDLAALLGRPIDLIEAGAVSNPFVLETIDRSKAALYAAA